MAQKTVHKHRNSLDLDMNLFLRNLVRLSSAYTEGDSLIETLPADQDLPVVFDPFQMAEALAALLRRECPTSPGASVITMGTSFLPICTTDGSNGDSGNGYALLYIHFHGGSKTRTEGEGMDRSPAFRSLRRIVRQHNGSLRLLHGDSREIQQLNIYLPISSHNHSSREASLLASRGESWFSGPRQQVGLR